jgi:hypothetical protein
MTITVKVTRTSLKTGGELRRSERVSSSWSTSGTRRLSLVTTPVISHEWGKDREVLHDNYREQNCNCIHDIDKSVYI